MGLTDMQTIQPILLVGKPMVGKTTGAISKLGDPIIMYANEMPGDIYSLPADRGILIEDVHYKADVDTILEILKSYKGEIILTSINQKDVSSKIKNRCKLNRATRNWGREKIQQIAPNSDDPDSLEKSMYDIMMQYMRNPDRDVVAKLLKHNKPTDNYLMLWLSHNIHTNLITFIDGHVKRRWPTNYLYEMAAYSISGNKYSRLNAPKKGNYTNTMKISRRVGLKDREQYLFKELLYDEDFWKFVKTKVNNAEWRKLGLGEKRSRKNKIYIKPSKATLEDWS